MRILLLAAAAALTLIGGAAATVAITDHSLALAGSTTSASPAVSPARTTEDVSGPCDEAEHANDARCAGTGATTTGKAASKATRREDRAGHRHRGQRGRGGSGRSVSSSGPSADDHGGHGSDDASGRGADNSGSGSDDGGGHGGGGNSGHGGGGRDHPEDD
jgi:hypothetical protein